VAVADSHGTLHPAAPDLIRELDPFLILHAGDIGDLSVLDELEQLAPVVAVRGNIDGRASRLFDLITVELSGGDRRRLTVLLAHIALNRTRLRREVRNLAFAQDADLVVCGHSHLPWIGTDQGLVVFNPGSLGPRRFSLPVTLGLIEIKAAGVDLSHWNCETGQRWQPGGPAGG